MKALRNASDETTEEVKLDDSLKDEKVLGLIWRPHNDTLGFNLNFARVPEEIVKGSRIPTKREALKTVMSLYDPLGLVSPVTNQAKQILQETWRQGTGWDDELPKEAAQKWTSWISQLQNLRNLEIPRYHSEFSCARERELHTFVDASETSYAAAVYWRIIDEQGNIHVNLAAAKARVAPLKLTSIPRLELQAAVLGSRLAKTVTEEYQMKPSRRYYWTDSKTVLQWIRSGPRVFKSFVAHRIAEIEEETTVNEWRWIPTAHNVADDATRDVPANFTEGHRWFNGPNFLKNNIEAWPKEKETSIETTREERVNVIQQKHTKLTESLPVLARFSSWLRLIRTTARVLQFINLLKSSKEHVNYKRTTKQTEEDPNWKRTQNRRTTVNRQQSLPSSRSFRPLDGEFIRNAEDLWVRASQQESFIEDITAMKNEKEVPKESRLRQLALIIEDEVVKLKSRIIAAAEVLSQQKQPAILDGDHKYTRLYLDWLHKKLHHAGTEMIVNEARQHYWILRLRPTVKNIVKSCLKCRIKKAVPAEPPTGDHPHSRLAHHCRPFTYTGLDYFGPLTVTVGRSRQKRYVALFTCLTTRAVHLEIAGSLSTDSAILALRRFIARRGSPTEIYSDNGTNLRGADRELREALQDEASNYKIAWKYIPPSAPFMGGAWERLVRSVKTALYSVLEEKHPQEETLATLLCEAEYTVNNRPLTHVSTSPEDDEALTPNHFLLGGSGDVKICGNFTDRDLKLRHQWRQAQRLADMFWERWIKEYLPNLQHRREPRGHGKQLQVDDLVLIVDSNLPRNTWPRGKIVKTFPGQDGIVRAVDVKTAGGILRRPTKKLVLLPVRDSIVASPE